jgi:hypothetical protein
MEAKFVMTKKRPVKQIALNQRLTTTDHLVYKLYNLTPTEIAIVDGQA